MPQTFQDLDEFTATCGSPLGTSKWYEVTQDAVDNFAALTGDLQWIHVDTSAAARGPFGGTIAHGYFILGLLPHFSDQIYCIDNIAFGVNYGSNRVRFPSPVPVGSKVRAHAELISVNYRTTGTECTILYTVEKDGDTKPACVAEVIYLMRSLEKE